MFKVNLKYGLLAVITALMCCAAAFGTGVFAAAAQSVKLSANGGEAVLVMDFPQAAAEEIASMQISLVVSDGADVEFVPDSGLSAKIVESRYHEDTGVLTVYLAGTKALFLENAPLTVGRIKLNESNVSANVSVKEGSIKFVRGSDLVTPSGDVAYPNAVTISTGGSSSNKPSSPSSSSTPPSTKPSSSSSSSSAAPSVPGYSEPPESTSSSDKTEPVVVPVEPADMSALTDAVNRAGGYKRADYTEESYGTLAEVLKKAETVLSDKGASQEEVDEALLVLENAIGMLILANNAPSGTDSYVSSGTSSTVSDGGESSSSSGSSSAADPEKPSSSGSTDNSGSPSNSGGQSVSDNSSDSSTVFGTSRNESSEAQKSDNTAVMWIVIVMVVLAVAAVALIVAIKFKKK